MSERLLAVIPARGGSKELPLKALLPLAGRPLIAHSIELARRCPQIVRLIVSTDSEEIAETARSHGADVPFLRPADLARDETPMWPVVRHALAAVGESYDAVLLLQPTSPLRLPEDVTAATTLLAGCPDADGVVGVSDAHPNPIWTARTIRDGFLEALVPDAAYSRRQDVPRVVAVNGALYLWQADFIRDHIDDPSTVGRYLPLEIPGRRAMDIDTAADLETAEVLLRSGLVSLPWLD